MNSGMLGSPPPAVAGPLGSVLDQAIAAGAPAPPWVAVEDPAGRWVREVAAVPASERARGVVAVGSDEALVTAVRLGVGGALRLPPSTVQASAALDAAAAAAQPWTADGWLADLAVTVAGEPLAVAWRNRAFWRRQVGEPEMTAYLVELARQLEVVPALAPWPALVLEGRSQAEVEEAWDRVVSRRRGASQGVRVARCQAAPHQIGVAASVLDALADAEAAGVGEADSAMPPRPVHALPGGELVGWWSASEGDPARGPGWLAVPGDPTAAGFRWRVRGSDGSEVAVDDVLTTRDVTKPAARLPGWLGVAVGPGRPAGLLVASLAAETARRAIPLWVPNVDRAALALLLRLPGPFWVDGPATPDGPD